ncbi:MAG: hypothetical protein A3A86_03375 [Elusimicrobia bacterium RIFCSPLOWO2_01_FULL_60_11]|nr:MAG: hypothetical protein A3A86_03375 [Elusimicrobia bacterium RIFCSPLOWO2_01_FULL_60_11]
MKTTPFARISSLTLLGCMAFVTVAGARATIEINVLNDQTKKSFVNAKVSGTYEDSSGGKTPLAEKMTDQRGQYLGFSETAGKFSVRVSAEGFEDAQVSGEVSATDVKVNRRIRKTVYLKKPAPPKPIPIPELPPLKTELAPLTPMATGQVHPQDERKEKALPAAGTENK